MAEPTPMGTATLANADRILLGGNRAKEEDKYATRNSEETYTAIEDVWTRFQRTPITGLLLTNVAFDVSSVSYLTDQMKNLAPQEDRPSKICISLCDFPDETDKDHGLVWQGITEYLGLQSDTLRSIYLDYFKKTELQKIPSTTTNFLEALGNMEGSCLEYLEFVDMDFSASEHRLGLRTLVTNFKSLRTLKFLSCHFCQDSLLGMAEGLQTPTQLKKLCMNTCELDDDMMRIIVEFGFAKKQTNLACLELTKNQLKKASVLGSLLKVLPSLGILDVSGNVSLLGGRSSSETDHTKSESALFFSALRNHPSLKVLRLAGVRLSPTVTGLLFTALEGRACPLRSLDLMHNGELSVDDGVWFDFVSKLKNLRELFLPPTSIPYDHIVQVLSQNSSLIWFECGSNTKDWEWFLVRNRVIQHAKNMPKGLWPRAMFSLLKRRPENQADQKEGFYTFVLETHSIWTPQRGQSGACWD